MKAEPDRCPYDTIVLIRTDDDPRAWRVHVDTDLPAAEFPDLRAALKHLGDLTRVESGYRSLRD